MKAFETKVYVAAAKSIQVFGILSLGFLAFLFVLMIRMAVE